MEGGSRKFSVHRHRNASPSKPALPNRSGRCVALYNHSITLGSIFVFSITCSGLPTSTNPSGVLHRLSATYIMAGFARKLELRSSCIESSDKP